LLDRAGEGPLPDSEPAFVDGAVEVHAVAGVLRDARTLRDAVTSLLETVPSEGYLAIMAYLDRVGDAAAARLRAALATRLGGPVTFGWGPRFLHSTGQYHKGGPRNGTFLQVTGAVDEDVEVPGRPFTLGRLQLAQALGDLDALARRDRPAVRLHLRDRAEGMRQLLAVAEGAA
ncbi:MAG: glucose-6-phosphate isomerase, partial [Streptosporangiaceae bacterium]